MSRTPERHQLIETRWIEEAQSSPEEIRGLLSLVARRIEEAWGSLKYPVTIFILAYDAVFSRNIFEYDSVADVSDPKVKDFLREALRFTAEVRGWMEREPPELL